MLTMPPKIQFREMSRILEFLETHQATIECREVVTIDIPGHAPVKAESFLDALNEVRESYM
ncbi:MAG: hypothetical protein GF372_05180 [Candidatus Marinimicrobia bacterium]|nr:hypothetical protein [Candidatus Neomarinimicrobiota bacterium]